MMWSHRQGEAMQIERMLRVQSHPARQALPAGFARSTMAKVRTANARVTQRPALMPQRQRGFAPAALALAALVFIAALTALMIQSQSGQPRAPLVMGDTPASSQVAELPALREERVLSISSSLFDDALIEPIRSEADALIDTGREVGLTMLSALPARPSAWSEQLSESGK